MTMRNLGGALCAAFLLAACSSVAPDGLAFELGAAEFHQGDQLVIEQAHSSTGAFEPRAVVTILGRYTLASRPNGTLYFGTTRTEGTGTRAMQPGARLEVSQGSGTFELQHEVPGPGHLHVTFYDPQSGAAFGGQYFGVGDTLLVEKGWAYQR